MLMKTCKRKKHYPEWAKYKATDADGVVYVYSLLPFIKFGNDFFSSIDSSHARVVKIKNKYCKNWRKSLKKIED